MRRRNDMKRLGSILLLLASLLALGLAGRMHPRLLALRRADRLNLADPLENAPPLVAFTTVALGGFRGILADFLWVRASELQEEGKFFELVQLADWITKLEPRFTAVWAYQAWNMAYNISVMLDNPEDRWRWVRNGISLLRDEGFKYNPGDAGLYRELGWLFQHKLGLPFDEAQPYYLRAWAAEMGRLFDGPRPDYDRLTPEIAARMKNEYKLDPELMREVDNRYGPLDWRLPQAHAIYWAWRGLPYATETQSKALTRMILQSQAAALKEGWLIAGPVDGLFFPSPNLDLLPSAIAAHEAAKKANPGDVSIAATGESLLRLAILLLYEHNREPEARDLFLRLREQSPAEDLDRGFEPFMIELFALVENLPMDDPDSLIERAESQSLFWTKLGQEDCAAGYRHLASLCREQPVIQQAPGHSH